MGCTGDEEARNRGTQKSVLERKAPPTFPLLIEMRERAFWVTHWVEDSVDCLLHGKAPVVQVCKPPCKGCLHPVCEKLSGCTVFDSVPSRAAGHRHLPLPGGLMFD